ncbi:hypothetical protein MPSEU_000672600 [Mayamaea pseudoterrestris]|nr:hypothetical protein MPSEU_000672600 [Mayamaea pseudoterrestris]
MASMESNHDSDEHDDDYKMEREIKTPGADQLLNLFVPPAAGSAATTPTSAACHESAANVPPPPTNDDDEHELKTPHAKSSRPLVYNEVTTMSDAFHGSSRLDEPQLLPQQRYRSASLAVSDLFLPNNHNNQQQDENTALLRTDQDACDVNQSAAAGPYSSYLAAASNGLDDSTFSVDFPWQQQESYTNNNNGKQQQQYASVNRDSNEKSEAASWWQAIKTILQPSTLAGSVMFVLYHVVFCLANASAIIRPSHHGAAAPILGVMAKLSTVGILVAGPLLIHRLGNGIPALYPSMDLFLAPFLAQAAIHIDESLTQQYADDNNNSEEAYPLNVFLGSFVVLVAIGMLLAATLLQLAATFKLASLGTYLPYSVLCGFFSAVGVLLWALAFSVDNNGLTWKHVLFSGNVKLIGNSLLHHVPTIGIGIAMHKLGPKNPFFVILLILVTLIGFYAVLWATGTSLHEAQEQGWFWSKNELVYTPTFATNSAGVTKGYFTFDYVLSLILPPAPLDNFGSLISGYVNFKAVYSGLENMVALAFLYLLRSSIHASAMKKNVGNLVRRIPVRRMNNTAPGTYNLHDGNNESNGTYAAASEMIDELKESVTILNLSLADRQNIRIQPGGANPDARNGLHRPTDEDEPVCTEVRPKTPQLTLEDIFKEYSYGLYVVAFCGAFGICPTVATSTTMYAIGADGPAPQYGSIILLFAVYCINFSLVRFVPKTAFSALLVLGAVDTLVVWFIGAFRKTQDLAEFIVVPIIVMFSLWIGFLKAILLGFALSTFVFVAAFFRVGVVKFSSTGIEIRSRIERPLNQSMWLDTHGDLIQVLVLQNYLFFGNASSILNYIATMFEEVDESTPDRFDVCLPPIPKILLIDLSLITGMDTSTLDIFKEIRAMCTAHDCQLFLSGLSSRMRAGLALGGVVPDKRARGKKRMTLFFTDLDTALGKAEDLLIQYEMVVTTTSDRFRSSASGFGHALRQIDELLDDDFTDDLRALQQYVVPLELQPGERLFESDGGVVHDRSRGLFFIESGLLKIERDSGRSLTHTRTFSRHNSQQNFTLKREHARTGSVAVKASLAIAKGMIGGGSGQQTLRLARIGPGWVCGTYEHASGLMPSGITVAITKCRLHHLPFDTLEQIETENPALVLKLYKMLSLLMARRQEITIEHLSTLHNIMSSPAHSKPLSRVTLQALKR